jgi:D-beta-D-heptose 7-phosphate kinase/D-beta-D-heptose 1-phosphate adenosyltransferase
VIGSDGAGADLAGLFEQLSIPTAGLVVEEGRPTTMKTRIVASSQQVVRIDTELRSPPSEESRRRLLSYFEENAGEINAVIISDYGKGVVSDDLMDGVRAIALKASVPVIVDPKVRNIERYRRVAMVTPNHHEASRMSGVEIRDEATLAAAARALLDRLECGMVLITRGSEGMSLFRRGEAPVHIPTVARRVFDVTGAGDTVIATLALGMAAGLAPFDAALLANIAAGLVVGEVGTATATADQLSRVIEDSCFP